MLEFVVVFCDHTTCLLCVHIVGVNGKLKGFSMDGGDLESFNDVFFFYFILKRR